VQTGRKLQYSLFGAILQFKWKCVTPEEPKFSTFGRTSFFSLIIFPACDCRVEQDFGIRTEVLTPKLSEHSNLRICCQKLASFGFRWTPLLSSDSHIPGRLNVHLKTLNQQHAKNLRIDNTFGVCLFVCLFFT